MDSNVRQEAKDLNGAIAGKIQPEPEMNTVDNLAVKAGVEVEPGTPLNIYDTVKQRDEQRLDPPER